MWDSVPGRGKNRAARDRDTAAEWRCGGLLLKPELKGNLPGQVWLEAPWACSTLYLLLPLEGLNRRWVDG